MLKLYSHLIKISIKVPWLSSKKERKKVFTKTEHDSGKVRVLFGNSGKQLYL